MITINVVDPTIQEARQLSTMFAVMAGDLGEQTITGTQWANEMGIDIVTKADEIIDEVTTVTQVANAVGIDIVKDANTSLVTHDKKDMPWDVRIHSSSKAFNADGSWRIRRNVDPAYVTQIENELRGTVTITPVGAAIVPPPPPPPAAVEPDPTLAFVNFVNKITAAQAAKTLHIADVNVQILKAGLKSLPELATRTELIPDIEKALGI